MREILVSELMSPQPITVRAEQRLAGAADKMAGSTIRHLPVVDEDGRLVGILSQRDLLAARGDLTRRISEVMTRDVEAVAPETPAHEAAYLLLRHQIGCLPVTTAAGQLLGILTESDLVRVAYTLLGGQVPPDELADEESEADRV